MKLVRVMVIVSVEIWPLFAFEDDAGGFEGFEFVPDAFGDVYSIDAVFLTQHHIFYDRAIIIVNSHPNLTSQDNK